MIRVALAAMAAPSRPASVPLGAACFAAALDGAARRGDGAAPRALAYLVEAREGEAPESLASRIAASAPGAVGLSVYSWNREALARTARILRASLPGAAIFAGGPEATADPAGLAAEAGLDFAVVGEGEGAAEAVLGILAGEIPAGAGAPGVYAPGLAPRRAPASDPADLPSPWLAGVLDARAAGRELPWELARGCPYACSFCYESKGERRVRRLPRERITAELSLFARAAEAGVREIFVLDPTFNADRRRALELLDLFSAAGRGLRWNFEVRAELLDRELAARFSRLDCSLQIGLQSANPRALAAVGRSLDRKAFARKTAILGEFGVVFGLDLIYGLPGDGLADFEESLDWALGLGPNHLDVFPLSVLPGTRLADEAESLGLRAEARPPYRAISTRELTEEGFARAGELARACDRYYTRGRAVGWFLAALRPLRLRPSVYLRRLAEARGGHPRGAPEGSAAESLEIEAEHLAALEALYRGRSPAAAFPVLRDLVRFNGAWGRALGDGVSCELDLTYPYEEISGPAALDPLLYAGTARPAPCRIAVSPGRNGVVVAPAGRRRRGSR